MKIVNVTYNTDIQRRKVCRVELDGYVYTDYNIGQNIISRPESLDVILFCLTWFEMEENEFYPLLRFKDILKDNSRQ